MRVAGNCSWVRRIDIGSLHSPIDLAPLTELPAVEEITIESRRGVKDWAPLLGIPRLRTVHASIDGSVAAQLIAKGVAVDMH
ncbi:hypothetical protein [Actinocrispum sp. NPDC049592]|uniref:hypothetical protein n=1 Tax=Actinocrispum sp. NPDC049592 TaxID=3154835 RepID=UPI003423DF69